MTSLKRPLIQCSLIAACLAATATTALAHPHVFVDSSAELVFNASGQITAVRNVWRFDDAYSAFASQGLDTNKDGKLSTEELKPLADLNIESMPDYGYFTFLTVDGTDVDVDKPQEYWLQADEDGLLTLFFTLPFKTPAPVTGHKVKLEIYDPTYFVAFTFVDDKYKPVTLDGAPNGCAAKVFRPDGLDPTVAAQLAQIPASQRDIPMELQTITTDLTNGAEIACAK